jgi:predicted nucleic acid-binding protein
MYLLETEILSELREARAQERNRQLAAWAATVDAENFFISAISLQEIEIGILEVERDGVERAAGLRAWLTRQVLRHFQGRVLAIDAEVALRTAKLYAHHARTVSNATIGATAQVHGLTVVTRYPDRYRENGIDAVSPFEAV